MKCYDDLKSISFFPLNMWVSLRVYACIWSFSHTNTNVYNILWWEMTSLQCCHTSKLLTFWDLVSNIMDDSIFRFCPKTWRNIDPRHFQCKGYPHRIDPKDSIGTNPNRIGWAVFEPWPKNRKIVFLHFPLIWAESNSYLLSECFYHR